MSCNLNKIYTEEKPYNTQCRRVEYNPCDNSQVTYYFTARDNNNSRILQAMVHGKNSYDKKVLSGFGN